MAQQSRTRALANSWGLSPSSMATYNPYITPFLGYPTPSSDLQINMWAQTCENRCVLLTYHANYSEASGPWYNLVKLTHIGQAQEDWQKCSLLGHSTAMKIHASVFKVHLFWLYTKKPTY